MAVIFDLDDTLFDHRDAMARFLRVEFRLTEPVVEEVLAIARRGKAPPTELCGAIAGHVAQSVDEVWETVQRRFGTYAHLTAPAVLTEASARFTLGLLTNGGELNQTTKIDALRLERWIPHNRRVISGVIGVWKPAAGAFEAALAACEARAATSVYVGDDPLHDMGGAQAVGMRTCWVARGRTFPDTPLPDWTIDSIADLPSVWDEFPT